MSKTPREMTKKLLDMVAEGLLEKDTVITACMKWMSEDDVSEMMEANEFILEKEQSDE